MTFQGLENCLLLGSQQLVDLHRLGPLGFDPFDVLRKVGLVGVAIIDFLASLGNNVVTFGQILLKKRETIQRAPPLNRLLDDILVCEKLHQLLILGNVLGRGHRTSHDFNFSELKFWVSGFHEGMLGEVRVFVLLSLQIFGLG